MEFMLLIVNPKKGAPRESVTMAQMDEWAAEVRGRKKLIGGSPLHAESAGVRVKRRRGQILTTDGPFAESKEVIGGWIMLDVASRAEALEIAESCPATRSGVVTVHEAMRDKLAAPPAGTRYLLLFIEGSDFGGDPDGAKYREMEKWTDALKAESSYVECAGLANSPPPARLESRRGKLVVTDGPFAEAKEVIGGYTLVVAASRAAAIEIAGRCPHASWGEIEVREVLAPGPA